MSSTSTCVHGDPDQYFQGRQTITKSTIPTPVGPVLDAANEALAAIPAGKIPNLLDETAQASSADSADIAEAGR